MDVAQAFFISGVDEAGVMFFPGGEEKRGFAENETEKTDGADDGDDEEKCQSFPLRSI